MTAEEYYVNEDITVLCKTATSFPDGIQKAHKDLHSLLSSSDQRTFYGISHAESNGNIIYKAAAEQVNEGEAEKLDLETFTIRRGKYISEVLRDWRKDEMSVARTFNTLISDPRIDKKGYCLEIYFNENDMRCLVPLDQSYSKVTATSERTPDHTEKSIN